MIDWGLAGQLGAIGFSLVFGVLIVLAVTIWLVSRIISRIEKR